MKWALVLAFSLGGRQTVPADRWFASDKWMHFAASAVIQGVGYGLARESNGHGASLRLRSGLRGRTAQGKRCAQSACPGARGRDSTSRGRQVRGGVAGAGRRASAGR
jgi:hypothetical protein